MINNIFKKRYILFSPLTTQYSLWDYQNGWIFDSGQGNNEKRTRSSDFSNNSNTICFKHHWRQDSSFNKTTTQNTLLKYVKITSAQKKGTAFWKLCQRASMSWFLYFWISMGWIGYECSKRIPKERLWPFFVLRNT